MNVFLISDLDNNVGWLNSLEAHHCRKVLRLQPGDSVSGTDGKGLWITGTLIFKEKDRAGIQITSQVMEKGEHLFSVCLGVSTLRLPDRFEWLIEKSIELGVTEIFPLKLERTIKPGFRKDRLEKIMISALKQCHRSRLPILHEMHNLNEFLAKAHAEVKIMGWAEAESNTHQDFTYCKSKSSFCLLIGPEGDFSEKELISAKNAGFIPLDFGKTRLRTETAALFGISWLKSLVYW